MELRKVRELIERVSASNLVEVEVKAGAGSIRVARSPERATPPVRRKAAVAVVAPPQPVVVEAANESVPGAAPKHVVRSTLVGLSYAAAGAGQPPFVAVGQCVKAGDTLVLVEALKTMQPIESPVSGTVLEILIGNGQPVEFDQALFVIG